MTLIQQHSSRVNRARKGSALVIVLASLGLLAALALAFLVSIRTELKSSKNYASGVSSQTLAQWAFNLVNNQIADATKGVDQNGSLMTWASQPGMIRTYDQSGNPASYFKLYSSGTLQGTGSIDLTSAEAIPSNGNDAWYNQGAIYTDLNQPVRVSGTLNYPIIDGNNLTALLSATAAGIPAGAKAYGSGTTVNVDGFYVGTNAPVESGPAANPVPMPVKWLYLLAQGQIIAPTAGSGSSVTFNGPDRPTAQNPIVGRIAFWTDDETCKINLNTASEGVYWDTPRAKNNMEDVLKMNQPVQGEYQRYPGHPAMTSLSTVIKPPANWTTTTPIPTCKYSFNSGGAAFPLCSSTTWLSYLWAQKLYDIVPRIGSGGSFAGSIQTASGATVTTMNLDADRLYASVDELLFSGSMNLASGTRTLNEAALTGANTQTILNKQTLERDKFFLTASSRAPDINLFGKPRVSMWPITLDGSGIPAMTPVDQLIAFCTTSGSGAYRYYFQRQNPDSPTDDLPTVSALSGLARNRMLMEYLRSLTNQAIPGFGGRFRDKYNDDTDQILTEIFDYIRCTNLYDRSNPVTYTTGIPKSWYGMNWANKLCIGQVVPIVDGATRGFGRYPTVQGASVLLVGQVDGDDPLVYRDPNTHASVKVLQSNGTLSYLPIPATTTSQVDVASGKPLPVYIGTTAADKIKIPAVPAGSMRVQAVFLPQFFTPSVGAPWIYPYFQFSVDTSQLTLTGPSGSVPLNFPGNSSNVYTGNITKNDISLDETGFGDQLGLRQGLNNARDKFVSSSMDLVKGSYTLSGQVTIRMFVPTRVSGSPPAPSPSSTCVQTVTMDFSVSPPFDVGGSNGLGLAYTVGNVNDVGWWDSKTIRFVNYRSITGSPSTGSPAPGYYAADPDNPTVVSNSTQSTGGRFYGTFNTNWAQGFIIPPDVIRSVRVASGDTRLVAAQTNPPTSLFEANSTTDKLMGAHNFFNGYGSPYYGAALGRLTGTASWSGTYTWNRQWPADTTNPKDKDNGVQIQPVGSTFTSSGFSPATDAPLNRVAVGKSIDFVSGDIPGDWDNAPFIVRDGPFINRADEGDSGIGSGNKEPYAWNVKDDASGLLSVSLFTPNRMIPSPVTLGSLPTGVKAGRPWQTLLFRPEPGHPGSKGYQGNGIAVSGMPADHLLLDLFHMPVVEPYPISEPFSTAGRINMNYQIAPFTYINRDTGIRALLKAEKVISIPNTEVGTYKKYNSYGNTTKIRLDVDQNETLKGFLNRFTGTTGNAPDLFRSASEVCELPIVPIGATYADMQGSSATNYWAKNQLTGDNSKERIYATLYPRLTTKSNTFTIHVRVQTLKQVSAPSRDYATWTEGRDQITGEYRGYQTIERYIDPNDPGIVDYADPANSGKSLGALYKTRVVASKQFAP